MSIVLSLLVFLLSISMFFIGRENKIILILIKLICFSTFVPAIPLFLFQFPILCFFLSEIRDFTNVKKELKCSGLLSVLIIAAVSTLITILFSPHLSKFGDGSKFFYSEVVAKYCLLLAGYFALVSLKDLKTFYKWCFYLSFFLLFWTFICFIFNKALWPEWLTGADNVLRTDRLRLNSVFVNSFDYGYYSLVIFLITIYAYEYKVLDKNKCLFIFFSCIIGILTCGSRTVLLCFLVSFFYYLFRNTNLKSKIVLCLCSFCLFIIVLFVSPQILSSFSFVSSIFSSNSNVEGSSLDMRFTQLQAVLFYLAKNPLFGNGYGFFDIDLGWSDYISDSQKLIDPDLEGLESVIFSYLLERGIVGLALYFTLFAVILILIVKRRDIDKKMTDVLISIFISYHLYSIATGVLLSPFITLFFIGMGLKIIDLRKGLKYGSINHNRKL